MNEPTAPPPQTPEERALGRLLYLSEEFTRGLGAARTALNNARLRLHGMELRLARERETRIRQVRHQGANVLKWQGVVYRLLLHMSEEHRAWVATDTEFGWVVGWYEGLAARGTVPIPPEAVPDPDADPEVLP